MPGLLSDEQQQQQRNMGLLNIGLALMQPYNRMQGLGGHIGSALAAGNQAMQQYPQQAMEQQQFQMQIEEHRRKQAEAERMSQARSSFRQNLPDADRPLYDLDPGKYLEKRMYRDPKFQAFGGGLFNTAEVGPGGMPMRVGDVPQAPTDFELNLRAGGIDPNSDLGRSMYLRMINKQTTHAPPASTVVMGSPNFFTDAESGQTFAVQTSNRPGVGPQVTALPKNLKQSSADKPPTESELSSSGYARRMIEAENRISQLPPDALKPGIVEFAAGAVSDTAANLSRDPTRQMGRQAQEDWVRAKLRKESGAVIGEEEMKREISTYFPQIGDSPQVIEQKARSREIAIQAMEGSAGRAAGGLPKLGSPQKDGGQESDIQRAVRLEIERRRSGR